MAQHQSKATPTRVYSVHDGRREVGQVRAINVHEALQLGREEYGEEVRCAFLLPERKETRFSEPSRPVKNFANQPKSP